MYVDAIGEEVLLLMKRWELSSSGQFRADRVLAKDKSQNHVIWRKSKSRHSDSCLIVSTDFYNLASNIKLNGVCVALRKRLKPPAAITSPSRFSPACAPKARPTSCDSDAGVQRRVDAP
jgi:hypothetical protein